MKKNILLLFFFCSIANIYGQKNISRLSIAAKGGLDYYFVEPKGNGVINNAGWVLPSLAVEYDFNPIWSLRADFAYLTYNRQDGAGNTSDFSLLVSCNYLNLFASNRKHFFQNIAGYVSLGGGAGSYTYSINPILTTSKPKNNNTSPFAVASLSFEYNFSRSFALIAEGQIRAYSHDIGGLPAKKFYENSALVALAGIRYKINASKKTHCRNITSIDDCNCEF